MKVSMLLLHPLSESLGSTIRALEIGATLKKYGFDVTIYNPYEKDQHYQGVKIQGVKIFGLLHPLFRKTYGLLKKVYYGKKTKKFTAHKVFDENLLYKEIIKHFMREIKHSKPDVIITEQDFSLYPAVNVAEETGTPIIADIHNITAEELVASGTITENSPEYQLMQEKLNKLLHKVDGIVVVSKALKDYIAENYKITQNTVIVPPGGRPRITEVPRRPKPFKLVFAGMLEYREHVDLFVESLNYLKNKKEYKVYLTRKGSELENIQKHLKNTGVKYQFFWFPNRDDLFNFMKTCHIGILTSSNDKARILGPPLKLLDYMSVGLPVVSNYIGGWSDIIKEEEIGVTTDDDPRSFARGIEAILTDERKYNLMANNALRTLVGKYSWEKVVKPLVDLIKTVTESE